MGFYDGDNLFHYSKATTQAVPAHLWLGRIRLVAMEFLGLLDLSAEKNEHMYIDHNSLGRLQCAGWLKKSANSAIILPAGLGRVPRRALLAGAAREDDVATAWELRFETRGVSSSTSAVGLLRPAASAACAEWYGCVIEAQFCMPAVHKMHAEILRRNRQ